MTTPNTLLAAARQCDSIVDKGVEHYQCMNTAKFWVESAGIKFYVCGVHARSYDHFRLNICVETLESMK